MIKNYTKSIIIYYFKEFFKYLMGIGNEVMKDVSKVKVSKFLNEFMKSSFLPKNERKFVRILFIFWEKR